MKKTVSSLYLALFVLLTGCQIDGKIALLTQTVQPVIAETPTHAPPTILTLTTATTPVDITIALAQELSSLGPIFTWMPVSLRSSHYGYFNPHDSGQSNWNDLNPIEAGGDGPNQSVSLAFSRYSSKIAYIISKTNNELWISDIDLKNPKRLWIDQDGWLGSISNFIDIRIMWGINDRYIILVPGFNEDHIAIFDVLTNSMELWLGSCNMIAQSVREDGIGIWCAGEKKDEKRSYLVLEKGGILKTQIDPEIISTVIDWAYSPNGDRLLFATEELDINIANENGEILKLPARYESQSFFDLIIRQNLQWSHNGEKVLIYAYSEPVNLCSQWYSSSNNKLHDRPCWIVLDATSNNYLWMPTKESIVLDIPWEYLSLVHGATLSPNSEWLAMVLTDIHPGRDFHLYITSLDEHKERSILVDEAIYLKWEIPRSEPR